jgi:transcriptional regulator of acetoin/glycerol metabolism
MIGPDHLPPQIGNADPKGGGVSCTLETNLDDVKRSRLINALTRANGNRSQAARLLGISRTSVWKQIKKYGIELGS